MAEPPKKTQGKEKEEVTKQEPTLAQLFLVEELYSEM